MTTEQKLVKLPSGISLEAKLSSPETSTSEGGTGLAIFSHPWSWLGGRMEDQCEPITSGFRPEELIHDYPLLRLTQRPCLCFQYPAA